MKLRGKREPFFCFVFCARCHAVSSTLSGCDTLTQCRGVVLLNANKKAQLGVRLEESKLSCFNVLVAVVTSSDCKKHTHVEQEAVLQLEGLCSFFSLLLFAFRWNEGVLNLFRSPDLYLSVPAFTWTAQSCLRCLVRSVTSLCFCSVFGPICLLKSPPCSPGCH